MKLQRQQSRGERRCEEETQAGSTRRALPGAARTPAAVDRGAGGVENSEAATRGDLLFGFPHEAGIRRC